MKLSFDMARHLLQRAGFGASYAELQAIEGRSLQQVVRSLLDITAPKPLLDVQDLALPKAAMRQGSKEQKKQVAKRNKQDIILLNANWIAAMAVPAQAVREKAALFWHGHFACRPRQVRAAAQYVEVLRTGALGDFHALLLEVSRTPAMLQFLNNQQNRKQHPNENFAREVMELFTLGRGNYSEQDVQQAARAFTGWSFDPQGDFLFRVRQHDTGTKQVLGQSLESGEEVLALLCRQPACARRLAEKLYRHYVADIPHLERQALLEQELKRNGLHIGRTLEYMFTADWFYAPDVMGSQIKSPVALLAGIGRSMGVQYDSAQGLVLLQRALGQVLLFPPNVAGWAGGRHWIDSSTLLYRLKIPEVVFLAADLQQTADSGDEGDELRGLRQFRKLEARIDWQALGKQFAHVPQGELPQVLAAWMLPHAPQAQVYKLLESFPEDRSQQVRKLVLLFSQLPEFQLC